VVDMSSSANVAWPRVLVVFVALFWRTTVIVASSPGENWFVPEIYAVISGMPPEYRSAQSAGMQHNTDATIRRAIALWNFM